MYMPGCLKLCLSLLLESICECVCVYIYIYILFFNIILKNITIIKIIIISNTYLKIKVKILISMQYLHGFLITMIHKFYDNFWDLLHDKRDESNKDRKKKCNENKIVFGSGVWDICIMFSYDEQYIINYKKIILFLIFIIVKFTYIF